MTSLKFLILRDPLLRQALHRLTTFLRMTRLLIPQSDEVASSLLIPNSRIAAEDSVIAAFDGNHELQFRERLDMLIENDLKIFA